MPTDRDGHQQEDWCGLKWREGSLVGADLRDAQLDGCQWIRVGLSGAHLSAGWEHHATSTDGRQTGSALQAEAPTLSVILGHSSGLQACVWSPDGQRLLSGSFDASLKIWDTASGLCSWSVQIFPERQFASIDVRSGRILHASAEAWRWLGWRWTDHPTTKRLRILPAEAMGPLPA
jgi:hypothetical protein